MNILNRRGFATKNILYLGLGEMGHHIAGFFSKSYKTTVWNRTYSKTQLHESIFGTTGLPGDNPFRHNISEIDLLFSCLPTSKEIEYYADMFIKADPKRKSSLVWVDNTSGVPSHSKKIAEKLAAVNVGFIDAPVSGGRVGASAGTLAVMVGGKTEHFNRAEPVLKTIAKSLQHIGEEVGSGHAVKAYNNLLYASNVLIGMKVVQSIEKSGLNVDRALKTIVNGSGGSTSIKRLQEFMLNNRSVEYRFKVNLLLKDMGIALSQLEESGNDKVVNIFKDIMKIFADGAETDWDQLDVFDMFSFIENKVHS